jgi:hypothetical protein
MCGSGRCIYMLIYILSDPVDNFHPNTATTTNPIGFSRTMTTLQTSQSVVIPVTTSENKMTIIKTDFLIVGAGPAGGTLGCFLGSHGKATNLVKF